MDSSGVRTHRPRSRPAPPPQRGMGRLLRGWAAAVVATLLGAGSHTLAGSTAPGHDAGPAPVVWILTLALAAPLCTALAGRVLSWWRLSLAVGSSQLLFHWLYSQPATPDGPAASAALARASAEGGHVGHGIHGIHGLDEVPEVPAMPAADPAHGVHSGPGVLTDGGPVASAGTVSAGDTALGGNGSAAFAPLDAVAADHAGFAMAAAHLLAALATVLLLRRGEVLAARMAELAVGFVLRSPGARLARWVPAVRPPRPPSRPLVPVLRAGAVVLSGRRLRGPPVPAFCL